MITNAITDAIMSTGMKCLVDKLGTVEAEMFISMVRQNSFDYTEWRQDNLWQDMSINEILKLAADREKTRENEKQARSTVKGCLKGKVWMADDFDAPLEEMQVCMK